MLLPSLYIYLIYECLNVSILSSHFYQENTRSNCSAILLNGHLRYFYWNAFKVKFAERIAIYSIRESHGFE